jgi:hypothetical protein
MRNKRLFTFLTVIGLVAALTTTAYAATSPATTISRPSAPDIVGVWNVVIKVDAVPEAFEGFFTFFDDGTFLETNTFKETNPGNWIGAGNTYAVNIWAFLFDEKGQAFGKGTVRMSVRLDDADHFTAQAVLDAFDMAGKPMKYPFAGPGKIKGTRMQMELP